MFRSYSFESVDWGCPPNINKSTETEDSKTYLLQQSHSDDESLTSVASSRVANRCSSSFVIPRPELMQLTSSSSSSPYYYLKPLLPPLLQKKDSFTTSQVGWDPDEPDESIYDTLEKWHSRPTKYVKSAIVEDSDQTTEATSIWSESYCNSPSSYQHRSMSSSSSSSQARQNSSPTTTTTTSVLGRMVSSSSSSSSPSSVVPVVEGDPSLSSNASASSSTVASIKSCSSSRRSGSIRSCGTISKGNGLVSTVAHTPTKKRGQLAAHLHRDQQVVGGRISSVSNPTISTGLSSTKHRSSSSSSSNKVTTSTTKSNLSITKEIQRHTSLARHASGTDKQLHHCHHHHNHDITAASLHQPPDSGSSGKTIHGTRDRCIIDTRRGLSVDSSIESGSMEHHGHDHRKPGSVERTGRTFHHLYGPFQHGRVVVPPVSSNDSPSSSYYQPPWSTDVSKFGTGRSNPLPQHMDHSIYGTLEGLPSSSSSFSPTTTRHLYMDQRRDPRFLMDQNGRILHPPPRDMDEIPRHSYPGFTDLRRGIKGNMHGRHPPTNDVDDMGQYPIFEPADINGDWGRSSPHSHVHDVVPQESSLTMVRSEGRRQYPQGNEIDMHRFDPSPVTSSYPPGYSDHGYSPLLSAGGPFHPRNVSDTYDGGHAFPRRSYPLPPYCYPSRSTREQKYPQHGNEWHPHPDEPPVSRPRRRHSLTAFRRFSTTFTENGSCAVLDDDAGRDERRNLRNTATATECSVASEPVKPRRQWKLFGLWHSITRASSRGPATRDGGIGSGMMLSKISRSAKNGTKKLKTRTQRPWQRHLGFRPLQSSPSE